MMQPDLNGKYYITRASGGYSPCILGNNSKGQRYAPGSVLPNCVGWAWGRWHEVAGLKGFSFWHRGDAVSLWSGLRFQGLQAGYEPKKYGLMIWDNGSAGHVAFVEDVYRNGTPVVSESGWYFTGDPVRYGSRYGEDFRGGCSWMDDSYKYVGCVYHPCFADVKKIRLLDMDESKPVDLLGVYQDGRNYLQLSDLADAGYVRAGWDEDLHLPLIGVY